MRGSTMPELSGDVARHNLRYKYAKTALPQEREPASSKSCNKDSKKRRTWFLDLSANRTTSIRDRIYTQANWRTTSSVASGGGLTLKVSRSHRSRKSVSASALSSGVTPSSSKHTARTSGITRLMIGRPSIRRPRSIATSCNVMVVSSTGRWNIWVSCRHRSSRAVISAWSIATGSRRATPYRPAVTIYRMIH